eukprot:4709131-Pyramimonas_sp.AAC.1
MPSPWVDNSGITYCVALSEPQQLVPALANARTFHSKTGAAGTRESNKVWGLDTEPELLERDKHVIRERIVCAIRKAL